jgi:hypothetical protein
MTKMFMSIELCTNAPVPSGRRAATRCTRRHAKCCALRPARILPTQEKHGNCEKKRVLPMKIHVSLHLLRRRPQLVPL